jgi:c-di-GMP-binding flagellar brake protein YcgR
MGTELVGPPANSIQASRQSERRRSARYGLDISLVARPANNRSRAIHGRVVDLSRGGLSALIAADLQPGEVIELKFELPYAATHVRLEAAIRRRESYQYSLEFMHVVASDQEKIDRTCAALSLLQ